MATVEVYTKASIDTALAGKASTSHAATHASAGSDPITIAQSQVTGLVAALDTVMALLVMILPMIMQRLLLQSPHVREEEQFSFLRENIGFLSKLRFLLGQLFKELMLLDGLNMPRNQLVYRRVLNLQHRHSLLTLLFES